jgi:hypothetical protein
LGDPDAAHGALAQDLLYRQLWHSWGHIGV